MALTGVANWKVAGLIPGQGTCLGCRPGLWLAPLMFFLHIDVSLPLFLFLFSPLFTNK